MTEKGVLNRVELEKESIVSFLQEILRIPSETGKEGELQRFLAAMLSRDGLETDLWDVDLDVLKDHPAYIPVPDADFKDRPNLVGIVRGTGGGRSLILNGHVDTITAEPATGWQVPPYSGELRDDKVYGRGSSDMKGGVAAMTMAVRILRSLGWKPRGDVFIQYVVDEEVSGYGTLSAIRRGYTADACICCETSDLAIQPACIGRLWFWVDIHGKTSSISNRWESVSAIEKGMKIVRAVEDLEKMRHADLTHPLYPDNRSALPCAVCMFDSGTFPSAIPDRALLRGSMGLFPYESVREVEDQFYRQIARVSEADPWLRNHPPEIRFKELGADGAEIPVGEPIVAVLGEAFENAAGRKASISGRNGGSDIRYLIKYGGTPSVIFGPGLTTQMHATDEYVPVSNLITAVKTLCLAILSWCGS